MKQTLRIAALALIALSLAACSSSTSDHAAVVSPMEPPAATFGVLNPPLQASLFKEDQTVISNEDMERILTAKVTLPGKSKLAVIRFGQLPYWWGWSEDFVRTNDKIDADFLGRLRGSKRIHEVAYLPSLVTPTQMTIPYLRQAAARFQADLMLIYRTTSRNYDKQKFLARDQSRSYCTVEAVLVDTRTGIIPFSTVVTESFSTTRSNSDLDLAETIARTEQQAIAKAWLRLAEQTVQYLDGLP